MRKQSLKHKLLAQAVLHGNYFFVYTENILLIAITDHDEEIAKDALMTDEDSRIKK